MAANFHSFNHGDEDYIDMEVSSTSNFFSFSLSSPPQTRDFEFQMSSTQNERETTPSPADELFYKGKLLPLHLPPRLQMVQKLLQNSTTNFENTKKPPFEGENYNIPFFKAPSTNTSTPLGSCSISPSESCRVSSELNPDEYFFEWSTEFTGFIADNPKKSWSKKLKLIKQSLLAQKLKASRAYLKSLFSKSACSDESSAKAASTNLESEFDFKTKECFKKHMKEGKKNESGETRKGTYPTIAAVMKGIDKEIVEDGVISHRKSFSGTIKRHCVTKSSSSSSSGSSSLSSSFSLNSSGFYELQFLKRSCSAISEIESSIEGAIAHCKQSQQMLSSSKTSSEVGICSLSVSMNAGSEDKER